MVGIGINVNQTVFDKALINVVSLKQISGKSFDIVELGKELHGMLMNNLAALEKNDKILRQYNEHLYKLNHLVTLKKDGVGFETVIKGVLATGRLTTIDTFERIFDFGDVEWVITS